MNNFAPKTSIDEYIYKSELNSLIYQTLLYVKDSTANGRHKLKRQPLEIFNQAYAICEELQAAKHPEEMAVQVWERLRNSFFRMKQACFSRSCTLLLSTSLKRKTRICGIS